jgi:BirA family biotin operon repressor/biotin-[acetyl-CoA-carboxylase] ligase
MSLPGALPLPLCGAAGGRETGPVTSAWSDLDRPPLPTKRLVRALAEDGFDLRVVDTTESTNADVAAAARDGAAEGLVVAAEFQHGGRGRLSRTWVSPARAGLTFSVLLRPPQLSGWVPLLAGVALVRALRERGGVEATVKWPNDVLVEDRKLAGILCEHVAPDAVVVGVGLNVTTHAEELPGPPATSLLIERGVTDRAVLLPAILRSLAGAYAGWRADPQALPPAYRSVSSTFGRPVRLSLPDGSTVEGVADGLDDDGRIVVNGMAYGAGDVVHLRAASDE